MNHPVVPPGETIVPSDPADKNIVSELKLNADQLRGPAAPPRDRAWRRLAVTDRRTKVVWAHFVRDLVDALRFAGAERIVLVQDQLNTHTPASLYEAFAPAEAKRLPERLEIHYTPKHGSWLNVAEVELSVPGKRLKARVGDKAKLTATCAALERERNRAGKGVDWQFTTADARVKLKRLYPTIQVS